MASTSTTEESPELQHHAERSCAGSAGMRRPRPTGAGHGAKVRHPSGPPGRFTRFLSGSAARWRRYRSARVRPVRGPTLRLARERLIPPINPPTSLDGPLACARVAVELPLDVVDQRARVLLDRAFASECIVKRLWQLNADQLRRFR